MVVEYELSNHRVIYRYSPGHRDAGVEVVLPENLRDRPKYYEEYPGVHYLYGVPTPGLDTLETLTLLAQMSTRRGAPAPHLKKLRLEQPWEFVRPLVLGLMQQMQAQESSSPEAKKFASAGLEALADPNSMVYLETYETLVAATGVLVPGVVASR